MRESAKEEAPVAIDTSPDVIGAAPVDIDTSPEFDNVDAVSGVVPVLNVREPESVLPSTEFAVSTVTPPLAATLDEPPLIVTIPPDASLEAPAITETELPAPDALEPTAKLIAPPRPEEATSQGKE